MNDDEKFRQQQITEVAKLARQAHPEWTNDECRKWAEEYVDEHHP